MGTEVAKHFRVLGRKVESLGNQFCLFVLRQGLIIYPRLAWNSFSCLSLLSAGITGVYHHSQQTFSFDTERWGGCKDTKLSCLGLEL
jgi:hypothetical protein